MAVAVTESKIFPQSEGIRLVVTKGGSDLGPSGDDLKEGIGLLFGRQDVAELIQAKDWDFGIEIDQAIEVLRLGELGGEIEERDKDGLIAFEDGIMADGRGQMGFSIM